MDHRRRRHPGPGSPAAGTVAAGLPSLPMARSAAATGGAAAERSWEEIAATAGEPIEALRQEIDRFRLALSVDLALAAAAVEADALDVGAAVIADDLADLPVVARRLEGQLRAATDRRDRGHPPSAPASDPGARVRRPAPRDPPGSWRRATAAAVLAAAAGTAGLGLGLSWRSPATPLNQSSLAAAERSLNEMLLASRQHWGADRMVALASSLEGSLLPVMHAARRDPAAAQLAAQYLFGAEQVMRSDPSAQTAAWLASTDALLGELTGLLPAAVLSELRQNLPAGGETTLPPALTRLEPTPSPRPTASARATTVATPRAPAETTSPSPDRVSASPAPTPRPTASYPATSPTASPSPSGSATPSGSSGLAADQLP